MLGKFAKLMVFVNFKKACLGNSCHKFIIKKNKKETHLRSKLAYHNNTEHISSLKKLFPRKPSNCTAARLKTTTLMKLIETFQ